MEGMDISPADALILLSGTLVPDMHQRFTTGGDEAVPVAGFLIDTVLPYLLERGPKLPLYPF